MTGSDRRDALAPRWLSHHHADEADRCVRVGDRFVCRRCLAMFAGFFPALALLLSSWSDDLQAGDIGLVLALTLVAGIEFVQVARRRMDYSARRVLVLSPAAGAVLAWLGVTGMKDGLGTAHLAFGALAFGVLLALFRFGAVERSTSPT
ncbi:hypothetical protein [Actinospongicola halichondriae]|uniref:hypothetical protein n=1 Tax=Actinospongicola halichondriae TaxID=3236844 RepID=UPI003D5337DD